MVRALTKDRRDAITRLLRETGFVRNSELSDKLGVSVVTIRQDVEALCAQGLLQKTYGGAMLTQESSPDSPFDSRSREHADAKRRIGAAAAKLVRPGETILLDAGSTTIEIARRLPANSDVTVVTCALNIALEAIAVPGVSVILCGGKVNPRTLSVSGHQAERELTNICADRLFLATYGIDKHKGLAERNFDAAQTKRALISAAREIVLVCDASKFGEAGPVLISPVSVIHRVITDEAASKEYLKWFHDQQILVNVV